MTFSIDEEIKKEFLLEAKDIIADIENILLSIENDYQTSSIKKEDYINHLFRLVHTLKGSSLCAGFEEFGKFIHIKETVLVGVRDGMIAMEPNLVEILIDSNDLLKEHTSELTNNFDVKGNFDSCSERLTDYMNLLKPKLKSVENPDPVASSDAGLEENIAPAAQNTESQEHGNENIQLGTKADLLSDPKLAKEVLDHENVKILILDDEEEIRNYIQFSLEEFANFELISTGNPIEAKEIVEKNKDLDLVISDIYMPEMTGIEFASAVRTIDPHLPIIMISGFASRSMVIELIKLKVFQYLDKPFSEKKLTSVVYEAIRLKKARQHIEGLSRQNFKLYRLASAVIKCLDPSKMQVHDLDSQKLNELDGMLREVADNTHQLLKLVA